MSIVATPGAANANSYATIAEATTYHGGRLNADAWTDADDATRESALIMAATFLDAMPQAWTGQAADPAVQALSWPRVGMKNRHGYAIDSTVIPQTLKNAQAEFARQLIEADRLADNDVANQGITSLKAGPVSLSFKEKDTATKESEMVPANPTANAAGSAMVPDSVKVMLVPSWLHPTVSQESASNSGGLLIEGLL